MVWQMRAYWLHTASWSRIVTHRVRRPESIGARLVSRRRPDEPVPADGQLVLLSCSHTVDPRTGEPVDRRELLDRIIEALSIPEVDGVVAPAEILEELTLLNVIEHRLAFCNAATDPQVAPVSGNASLLGGVPTATIAASNFDGGVLSQHWIANGSSHTSQSRGVAGRAVELAAHGLPLVVDLRVTNRQSDSEFDTHWSEWIDPLHATSSAMATGSGVWVAVPAISGVTHLAKATGFPMLIRDTDLPIQPDAWQSFFDGELPLTIRGMVLGASALFPVEGTVAEATGVIARAVRDRAANPEADD